MRHAAVGGPGGLLETGAEAEIWIVVEGGVVQSVFSPDNEIPVRWSLIDYDAVDAYPDDGLAEVVQPDGSTSIALIVEAQPVAHAPRPSVRSADRRHLDL